MLLDSMLNKDGTADKNIKDLLIYVKDAGSFNEYVAIQEWSKNKHINVIF